MEEKTDLKNMIFEKLRLAHGCGNVTCRYCPFNGGDNCLLEFPDDDDDEIAKKVIEILSEGKQPNHETPPHYQLDPEPIDVIKAWGLDFCLGNVIKYVSRAGHKDGVSRDGDLHKAMNYLRMELEDQE